MKKILLVDDEKSIVNVLSISLRNDGYDVFTAYSGKECLEKFMEETPDIVITDMKMPGIDGLEVLKRIKNLNPHTEVIIITGHGDMDSAIEALEYGASDFINKPIRDEALSVALERAKEKIAIRLKLKEYTDDLENMVQIATAEVRRKSDFQTRLITSSNDGIVATDEEGSIIIFNPAAEQIFGYSRLEVVRKMKISDLYLRELADEFTAGLKHRNKIVETRFPWREITVVDRNGERVPTRFSGTILYEKGQVMGSVAFFQDLREIKRLERELVRSERLAAIGQTVAGLAHYIKNILTGLKGGSYVVNIGFLKNNTDKLKSGWEMIEKNIEKISELVMDLLTYSKDREPDYRPCLPNEIAGEIFDLMADRAATHRIELIRDFDPSVGEVLMDPDTIYRALLNLVTNAIDACVFDKNADKKWIVRLATAVENNEVIRFEVTDNGCGMSDEVKSQLFSSFFSTKKGKGTGLGLLVTKKIIDEHGGSISVATREGEGSSFTVRLSYKPYNRAKGKVANA